MAPLVKLGLVVLAMIGLFVGGVALVFLGEEMMAGAPVGTAAGLGELRMVQPETPVQWIGGGVRWVGALVALVGPVMVPVGLLIQWSTRIQGSFQSRSGA